MRRLPLLIVLAVFAAMMAPAHHPAAAQTFERDRQRCQGAGTDPDIQIGGCTRIIQSGNLTDSNLSAAFYNR